MNIVERIVAGAGTAATSVGLSDLVYHATVEKLEGITDAFVPMERTLHTMAYGGDPVGYMIPGLIGLAGLIYGAAIAFRPERKAPKQEKTAHTSNNDVTCANIPNQN